MIELYKQPQYTEKDLCNFARVCTESNGSNDEKLIRDLIIWNHMSPFRHVTMTFVCSDIPIYTMRQWTRHQIGSEFLPVFEDKDGSAMMEKSGRYTEMLDYKANVSELWDDAATEMLGAAFAFYTDMVYTGVKKEEARQVLPLCTTTKFIWTVNLDSLMHFLSLRMDKHAQKDIRENADAVYKVFEEYYPTIAKEWKQRETFLKAAKKFYRTDDDLFDGDNEDQIYDYLRR